jgi:hypothetical protein
MAKCKAKSLVTRTTAKGMSEAASEWSFGLQSMKPDAGYRMPSAVTESDGGFALTWPDMS